MELFKKEDGRKNMQGECVLQRLTKEEFNNWVKQVQGWIPIELKIYARSNKGKQIPEKEFRTMLLQYLRSLDMYTRDKTQIVNQALINEGVYT